VGRRRLLLLQNTFGNDQNYWQQVESYVSAHSEARFSHSVCPACYEAVVMPQLAELEIEG